MSKPTAVIVLCEDNRTFSFTRSYLKKCGIRSGIRPVISQRGSGFTFVVNSFPAQVNAYRLAKARIHTWLIAVVDADTGTVAQRLGEMDRKLAQAQEQRVRAMHIQDEKIARLVPRRNIETWILALNASSVDETENYKEIIHKSNEDWAVLIPAAAETFFTFTRKDAVLPDNLIDSLRLGIDEMHRVSQMAR
jgi:hypothetical protein